MLNSGRGWNNNKHYITTKGLQESTTRVTGAQPSHL